MKKEDIELAGNILGHIDRLAIRCDYMSRAIEDPIKRINNIKEPNFISLEFSINTALNFCFAHIDGIISDLEKAKDDMAKFEIDGSKNLHDLVFHIMKEKIHFRYTPEGAFIRDKESEEDVTNQ